MSELMKIKLAEGRRVKDPYSQTILEHGKIYNVKRIQFWLKRIAEKDVELIADEKVEAAKDEKVSKKKEKKGE